MDEPFALHCQGESNGTLDQLIPIRRPALPDVQHVPPPATYTFRVQVLYIQQQVRTLLIFMIYR
jgi:hypothetical protein